MSLFPNPVILSEAPERAAGEPNGAQSKDPEASNTTSAFHTTLPTEPDAPAPPRRIPNLGHALLFVSLTALTLFLFQVLFFALGKSPIAHHAGAVAVLHPRLQIAILAATYLTTLAASWLFFPLIWQRPFLDGVRWSWATAHRQAGKLIALGFVLGFMMQIVTYFVAPPKAMPIDQFFLTPADAWLMTLFGTLLAPAFEEICFRGFLLPAFAIAYDWLSLPRTPDARARWQATTTLSPDSFIFSAILTSAIFAWMHAAQYASQWAALLALFSISLVLTFVRIKTGSVAASTIVHASYNLFDFLLLCIATGGYRHLDRLTQ
jgi:membrane protease YdiL (CAAX protease family)